MRGYAVVALNQCKTGENVGGAMRAAGVYGAAGIIVAGTRPKECMRHPTDTMRAWRHIPCTHVDDVLAALPFDCVPVAVEKHPRARPLPAYTHPERAFYIFGPEDGSLPEVIVSKCRDVVMIPMERCMNLAATVNVVLYDRCAKEAR